MHPFRPLKKPALEWTRGIVLTLVFSGIIGGIAGGAIVGPEGAGFGLLLGLAVGAIAGRVMAKEQDKADARTRELDAILGVSEGRIGAAPLPPHVLEQLERTHRAKDAWLSEWLTPPPPAAR